MGRLALTADAAYCALAAACVGIFARPLSAALNVPIGAVLLAAFGTASWAALLHLVARHGLLRPWLIRVLAANIVAVGLIGALAATRPPDALSLLLVAVAVEVAAFAVVQASALRRLV
jgi:uncharacterized membrane protein YfcA